MEFQKRLPAQEKTISEIEPEKDIRVRILGTVVDKGEDSFVIDDGGGHAQVTADAGMSLDNVKVNDSIKVIGRVFASENGFELRAEALQNANGIDLVLYKKARELEKGDG